MFDSLRDIIKWVIITLLIVLIVFLLIKISGGSSENKKDSLNDDLIIENPMEGGIQNDTFEEPSYDEYVEVGDTASTAGVSAIIGSMIIGGTTFYIRKNKAIYNN
jgi:hypothetical protein